MATVSYTMRITEDSFWDVIFGSSTEHKPWPVGEWSWESVRHLSQLGPAAGSQPWCWKGTRPLPVNRPITNAHNWLYICHTNKAYSRLNNQYNSTLLLPKTHTKLNNKTNKGWCCGHDTLLIFSFGWVSRLGKCERTSQLSTTCVCSSVPVTMLPTALRAAVCRFKQNQ